MDFFTQFSNSISPGSKNQLNHVRLYMEWLAGSVSNFYPSVDDDVHLRTYLWELKLSGTSQAEQNRQLSSIRDFYQWAKTQGIIEDTPDHYFSIERPTLTRRQIRKRQEIFSGTPQDREVARLKVLNQLSEQLNHAYDIQTTMQVSLEAMLSTLALNTGWAYLLPAAGSQLHSSLNPPPHDFALAAACSLPPGLEKDERYFLCRPDDCHCQMILRAGQMRRAVNIVECTRLEESTEADGDNRGLLFHASIPIIVEGQPLGIINVATEEWQFLTSADLQLLSTIGAQVAVALERSRLYELTNRHRQRMENELQLAHIVQTSLLPNKLPEIEGYSIAAEWRSAREMAGDFYDIIKLADNRWGIVVADVSDKGAPAAMYMAMTRSLIRSLAELNTEPAETLLQVDRHLNAYSDSGMFVTVFYGILDADSGTLTYASAGHDPPLLRFAGGRIEEIPPTGPLLGVIDEIDIDQVSMPFSVGDAILIYTDGVIDALNPDDQHYGVERLKKAAAVSPLTHADVLLQHIKKDLEVFIDGAPSYDDITCLILVRGK